MAPAAPRVPTARRLLPGWFTLHTYERRWLRGDLLAGLAVAAYAVPQCVAYAEVAGLPAAVGLWALAAPALLYAVLGSSRRLSVGPESTTALMIVAALAPLAAGNAARYLELSAALALVVGAIAIVARIARLGFLANLLSRPILAGYMTGVAVLMIVSQLGKVTGVPITAGSLVGKVTQWAHHLHELEVVTLSVAVGTLVVLVVLHRVAPRLPGPLIAVAGATIVVAAASLRDHGVKVIGSFSGGLPHASFGLLRWEDTGPLLAAAAAVAAVAFSDNVLTARAFGSRHNERVDADAELLALGAVNLGAGLLGGMPVSSSGSRAAIADAAGAHGQVYSLVAAGVAVLVAAVGGSVLASLPEAALGALVIYAACHLIDVRELHRLWVFRRRELVLAAIAGVGVAVLGVLPGIGIAVLLSAVELLARLSRPHDAVCGKVEGIAGLHDVDDHPGAVTVPGLVVYRFDGPLSYLNASFFLERAIGALDSADPAPRWLLLNVEAIVEIDATGAEALLDLYEHCELRGVHLAMARVKHDLATNLQAAGVLGELDPSMIFPTLPVALDAYEAFRELDDEDPPLAA